MLGPQVQEFRLHEQKLVTGSLILPSKQELLQAGAEAPETSTITGRL